MANRWFQALRSSALVASVVVASAPTWDVEGAAPVVNSCPNAVPNDGVDDAEHIQNCLISSSEVVLQQGVYDIEDKIRFKSHDRLLTSVGGKATLRARPWLTASLLEVDGADDYEISELILDGDRNSRWNLGFLCPDPGYPGANGSNFHFSGSGFVIHHIDTINAPCGSGMEGTGTNFQIYSIYAADNGGEASVGGGYARWADGVTLKRCTNGSLHGVFARNNTDVGIMVAKAQNCSVRFNTVLNDSRYAFAGIHSHAEESYGSVLKDNVVMSGYDRLSFGVAIGNHPWNGSAVGTDAGEVRHNVVSGAVVNLAVDGIASGWVAENDLSSAQGTRAYYCSYSGDVTYGHIGSASVQGGACMIQHDNCGCQ